MRKTRYLLAAVMIMALLLVLNMCQNKQNEEQSQKVAANIYYESEEGYLVPVSKSIAYEEGVVKAVVSELSKIDVQGLYPTVLEDSVLSIDVVGDTAKINIKEFAFDAKDQLNEHNRVSALVNTLTDIAGINKVKILVNGKEKSVLPCGTDISKEFSEFEINAESLAVSADNEKFNKVLLYFADVDMQYMVPITRYISGEASVFNAVNEAIKGPENTACLLNAFPAGLSLYAAHIDENNVLNLNFSREFENLTKDESLLECALNCISLTAGEFEEVGEIRIYVCGKPLDIRTMAQKYPNT